MVDCIAVFYLRARMMKVIKIIGGLGNQMFEYALYRKLRALSVPVRLDDREIRENGNIHQGLELERAFGLMYDRAGKSDDLRLALYSIKDKTERIFANRNQNIYLGDAGGKLSIDEIAYGPHIALNGYWQDESIFRDIREILLDEFRFLICDRQKEKAEKTVRAMQEENSVSIHVRRGDYAYGKGLEVHGGICDGAYFEAAIDIIEKKMPDARYYVFSDDIPYAKILFPSLNAIFVDWNTGRDGYLDMYYMSKCKHHIISNSSFSWWGAWLGVFKDKIIICPQKWYNDSDVTPVPNSKEWIRI